jgi:putative endonuclease
VGAQAAAPADEQAAVSWCVYILRCADGTLYTGMTNDLPRRLAAHEAGRGARYTKGRGPLFVAYSEPCAGRGDALKREAAIKRLSTARKRALCAESGAPPRPWRRS